MKKSRHMITVTLMALLMALLCSVSTMAASSKTVALKSGKTYSNTSTKNGTVYYHKITVPKAGYITVNGYYRYVNIKETGGLDVTLCNSKKKPLENYPTWTDKENKYNAYYGVKKGTYYLKVANAGTTPYKVKYTFTAVGEKSGSTQKKAVSVTKNKTVKGVLAAGEKGTVYDWYKIKLTKAQKITLTASAKANDSIRIRVISANAGVSLGNSYVYVKNSTEKTVTAKAPKGTYYIQVARLLDDAAISGYYTLKWK